MLGSARILGGRRGDLSAGLFLYVELFDFQIHLSPLIAHSPVRDGLPSATANASRLCVALRREALLGLCALSTFQERGRRDELRPNQERIRCRLEHRSRSPRSMSQTPRVRQLPQVREHRAFPYLTRPSQPCDRKTAGSSKARPASG